VVAAGEALPEHLLALPDDKHLLAPSPQQQQHLDAHTATETKQPKRKSITDGQVLARQTRADALDPLRGSQTQKEDRNSSKVSLPQGCHNSPSPYLEHR
jgi:hypothetical protein